MFKLVFTLFILQSIISINDLVDCQTNQLNDTIDLKINNTLVLQKANQTSFTNSKSPTRALADEKLINNNNIEKCNKYNFKNSSEFVTCLCDATYCDTSYPFEWPVNSSYVLRFDSDKSGKRFAQSTFKTYPEEHSYEFNNINIDENVNQTEDFETDIIVIVIQTNIHKQQVLGHGGAITDAASHLINNLPDDVRNDLLNSYFQPIGSDYNLARVPIGGTDFSPYPYSLADTPNGIDDFELKYFKLTSQDISNKIPIINRVKLIRAQQNSNDNLFLFAASWSPPIWMKTNKNFVRGSLRQGKQFDDAYADYLIKFLREYSRHNITIFALSPQNEPLTPTILKDRYKSNSLEFSPERLRDFVASSLVPKLKQYNAANENKSEPVHLMLWDDDLVEAIDFSKQMLSEPSTATLASGFGIHWYSQAFNKSIDYSLLTKYRKQLPEPFWLLSTEASFIGKPDPGNWTRAEMYARDMIENFNNGQSVGWIDWNLAVNMTGGYTWSNNILDSAILVDLETERFYKNPIFYSQMHLSRFIKTNSYILPTSIYFMKKNLKKTFIKFANSSIIEKQYSSQSEKLIDYEGKAPIFAVAAEIQNLKSKKTNLMRQFSLVVVNTNVNETNKQTNLKGKLTMKRTLLRVVDGETNEQIFETRLYPSTISSFAFVV